MSTTLKTPAAPARLDDDASVRTVSSSIYPPRSGPTASSAPPGPPVSPPVARPARGRGRGWRRRARLVAGTCGALVACAALALAPEPIAASAAAPPAAAVPTVRTASRYSALNPMEEFMAAPGPDVRAHSLPLVTTTRVRYSWPTGMATTVLADFDPPAVVWGAGHRGVDLALAAGSQVLAAGEGTVAFAGMVAGRPVVSIDHADGIRTTYEPVEPCVEAGDVVTRGQAIGTLVAGHRADGADALHWGARTGPKTYVNPLRLLEPAVIRLKPLA
ncbi:M23 family metallopeptidase [Actinomyces sp. MRS3W]|uniref:M23 family metallopeptidase n=1 Tax=Actinomyces sp. MRS3W TaxID=2800796 RepID=UPI0028FD24B4|nr:M23 family metallopeptidase [Actinomyces sp. MRS3W]MDU0349364.1 M23 family metallopeptidase [Actinomyces sp. MRS3W]